MLYLLLNICLTSIIYLVPIIILIPIQFTGLQKIQLFLILFANICLMAFLTGNKGIPLLLITISIYLVGIDQHHLRNVCLFIVSYLMNVLRDNLMSVILCFLFHIDVKQLQTDPCINIGFLILSIVTIYCISKLMVFLFRIINSRLQLHTLPPKVIFSIIANLFLTLILFIVNNEIHNYNNSLCISSVLGLILP